MKKYVLRCDGNNEAIIEAEESSAVVQDTINGLKQAFNGDYTAEDLSRVCECNDWTITWLDEADGYVIW